MRRGWLRVCGCCCWRLMGRMGCRRRSWRRGREGDRAQGAGGGGLWGIARRQAALLLRRRGPASAVLSEPVAVSGEMAGDPADVAVWRADLEAAVQALGSSESEERV